MKTRVEWYNMAYQLRCDGCDLDRAFEDWADANGEAKIHEADNPDHWVTILDTQPA